MSTATAGKPPAETDQELAKRAAKAVLRMEQLCEGMENPPSLKDLVELTRANEAAIKAIDSAKILEAVEQVKAGFEQMKRQMRSSRRNANYIPGVEDQKVSLINYARGLKTNWSNDHFREKVAGLEYEIHKQYLAKAQNTEDYSAGGAFIPDQVLDDVIPAIYARSAFIALDGEGETTISVLDGLVGGEVKIPKFDGGLVAYWIGEEDDYALSQVKTGDVSMRRHKLGVLAKITDEMSKFASRGFETLFRRDMVRAAAEKLDYTIAFGTGGDHSPKGLAHTDGLKVYQTGEEAPWTRTEALTKTFSGAEHTPDDVAKMQLFLEEDKIVLDPNAPIVSSPRYFQRMKQLKYITHSGQTTEKPYLLGMPIMSDARLSEMLGMRIVKGVQIPSNAVPGLGIFTGGNSDAKYSAVFMGNLREFILGRWAGIEVVSDNGLGTGMVSDTEIIKLRIHVGTVGRQMRSIVFCPDAKVRA